MSGKEREIDALTIPSRPERIGSARLKAPSHEL